VIINEILLPAELNKDLMQLSKRLGAAQNQLKSACVNFARKEHAYRKAKALAYLSADGTVEKRKAEVDKICDDERKEAFLARAAKEASLENIRSIRAQLSALQSVAASLRSEMEMSRF
jgi:DNA-binding protein YbaB